MSANFSSQVTEINPLVASSDQATLNLADLLEPVRQELELVELWLQTNLIDDSPFVADLLSQIFKAGGKRIRPALVLLASKATSARPDDLSRLHIVLAVLTELIHTASLVHDDVIDQASLRRGKETVNFKWNDKLAVLVGDLLFAQASICLARLMNPVIVGIYGQVLGDLCAGEIRQMKQQYVTTVNFDHYIKKSFCKTASLFAAGCHSGAILNCSSDEVVAALKEYGLSLGICFQVIDDLLDVTSQSSELGKPAGGDLASGVITAPALFVLEANDTQAKRLEHLIKTRAVNNAEGLDEALTIIRTQGGVEKTMAFAKSYADRCRESLLCLPKSPYRDSLAAIADFMLTRSK
jgi:all-trans-nonaprenyl-diphosphate synthase